MNKGNSQKLVRSKIYDLIYYESLKEKSPAITSAQLAHIAKGGVK